jgi:hypothetical protein
VVLGNLLIFADEKCNNVTKKVCWHGDKKRKVRCKREDVRGKR